MAKGVAITRLDLDASELRRAAVRSADAAAARRMLALALVLEGHSRGDAAAACGMDRQSLRDWVHRYNASGLPGLSNKLAPGAAPGYRRRRRRRSPIGCAPARSWPRTGSCAGAGSTLRARSQRNGACISPSARSARCTVAGRGPGRPARHADLRLGREGQPAPGAARPAPPVGLSVRRRVPGARRRGGPRAPFGQCQGHEPASRGDQHSGRRRCPRRLRVPKNLSLLPTPELPEQPRLRHIHHDPRRLLRCLERLHRRPRTRQIHYRTLLGKGHYLTPLVLACN